MIWNPDRVLPQASGNTPRKQAGYMTAPDPLAELPKKLLPTGGRPYMSSVQQCERICRTNESPVDPFAQNDKYDGDRDEDGNSH